MSHAYPTRVKALRFDNLRLCHGVQVLFDLLEHAAKLASRHKALDMGLLTLWEGLEIELELHQLDFESVGSLEPQVLVVLPFEDVFGFDDALNVMNHAR